MTLAEYRRKRDFRRTPEPRGEKAPARKTLSFVIQKHDASHLHYDFRLELDGVLKSWAVPKGPDLDPTVKRLAMQVEDHPIEYGKFEGIIPEGEYGGGTVLLWDQGTWEPLDDAQKGLREGRLKFTLYGEKLKGGWMLVRRGGRAQKDERHWFLFKERDEFAKSSGKPITEAMPLSITTGRDLDEIAEQSDRVWGSSGEVKSNGNKKTLAGGRSKRNKSVKRVPPKTKVENRPRAVRSRRAGKSAAMPRFRELQLATLAKEVPPGDDWIHEIKFDGYRMLCRIEDKEVRFISRNDRDWTSKFPELTRVAAKLPVKTAILDGEVVALDPEGTSSFQALQNAFQSGRTSELIYYAFDILYLNGEDLTGLPIEERKEILRNTIGGKETGFIRYSDYLKGSGSEILSQACRLGLEGIICKRRGRPYIGGRGVDWLKVKCSQREEFVIGGFTKPGGARHSFGALLLGYYDDQKQLKYAGRVGTGFNDTTLRSLHDKLSKLVQRQSPFIDLSGTTGQARGVTWVKPQLVGEIEFTNWTADGHLRHPSFQGLREDKRASEVTLDRPLSLSEVNAMDRSASNGSAKRKRSTQRTAMTSKISREDGDIEVAGVRVSSPNKLLYPEGITKRELAQYYEEIADWILPHVAGRVMALVRCPSGSSKPCFYQKHPGEGASPHLEHIDVSDDGKPEYHMAIRDVEGLISLVQMGVLEIHTWGSTTKNLEKPDRLIFDLDPDPSVEWRSVVTAAQEVRLLLQELGLTSFLKTTGGKGLHIVVPVKPRVEWEEAKTFCKQVADTIVMAAPDRYIAKMSKAARRGKIFIDYLRNGRGATAIAPYSTRAKPGATVSVPISWDELTPRLKSDHFTVRNLPSRLKSLRQDPWKELTKTSQQITSAMMKQLTEMTE